MFFEKIVDWHTDKKNMTNVFSVLFFTVTDDVLRSVALNKSAYQVSTYTDEYGEHGAGLANDGSRQTNYEVVLNGCVRSESETNPWWTVDLGVETLVAQVNLTNRADADGNELNFSVFDAVFHVLTITECTLYIDVSCGSVIC